MYTVTWRRERALLRVLKQKTEEPLGGAICDLNVQYWYQNDQWMIFQRLVGISKQYRKYFRFSAKNRFLIFHPDLKSHLRSKIVRISWKFGQRCKIRQIIIIYEKILYMPSERALKMLSFVTRWLFKLGWNIAKRFLALNRKYFRYCLETPTRRCRIFHWSFWYQY